MSNYQKLFSPLLVGNMILRNRIIAAPQGIIPAHKIISSTNYGAMSAWDRAMGGSGLVFTGSAPDLYNKYELDTTKEIINVAKQDGCKVGVEISFFFTRKPANGGAYGPSEGTHLTGCPMHEMSIEQIHAVTADIAKQAANARKIGYDCILLEFGHDSLHSQFMSEVWNQRTDEYGGSDENRIRFSVETIRAVRQAVGKDYPVILRLSRQLFVPETFSEDQQLAFIQRVENEVQMVNIAAGMDCYGGTPDKYVANIYATPNIFMPHNFNKDFCKRVKENCNVLVCGVGGNQNGKDGEELIEQGYMDAVMYGRSLIADPYWPKKTLAGKEKEIVPCIRCNQCYHIATEHWNTQCSVNPRFRREDRMALTTPLPFVRKHVVIIGGGVAGMVAAIGANEAGHKVTLLEKENRLGGLLNWASKGIYKEDLRNYFAYLVHQMEILDIDVRLNTLASPQLIQSLQPDRLIIAIGSDSRILPIEGADQMMDVLEAIDHPEKVGQKVAIVGGGSTGCEVAFDLAEDENRQITIIEMADQLAAPSNWLYKNGMRILLQQHPNIKIQVKTKVTKLQNHCLTLQAEKQSEQVFDTIINASGRVQRFKQAIEFYGIVADTVMVGDCERAGAIIDAVNIAYFVGKNA